MREVEKLRERYDATRFAFYSPEEVHALVRAAAKSGHGRVVPMVHEVAEVLARLSHRGGGAGEDDLVFPGEFGMYLDGSASAGASLRRARGRG